MDTNQVRVGAMEEARGPRDDEIVVTDRHLVGEDFGARQLSRFVSIRSRFEQCRFDGMVIKSVSFGAGKTASEYVGCSFDGATLSVGPSGYARFVGCSFENTRISQWRCVAVELVDCTFAGRLNRAIFHGAVGAPWRETAGRDVNQFEGNDFSRARLINVSFRSGIDLTKQRLPVGEEYVYLGDAPAQVRRARIAYDAWEDLEAKEQAYGVLGVMESHVAEGQRQLLMRPDNFPRAVRPGIRRLLAAAVA